MWISENFNSELVGCIEREVEADDRRGVPASSRCALRGSRLRRFRLSFGAGRTAEDLDGHPEVAQGVEVGDLDPAVLTAEHIRTSWNYDSWCMGAVSYMIMESLAENVNRQR